MLFIGNLVEFVRLMVVNEEQGIFWPQNAEYSNTTDLVAMIAQAHGKKICKVKGFTWALKLLSHCTGLVNKAFGSLYYDRDLSLYRENYCKVNLQDSIRMTEEDA